MDTSSGSTGLSPEYSFAMKCGSTAMPNPASVALSCAIKLALRKRAEIFGEKEPADYVYQVIIGAVRSYKLLSDGRRQIGAFHLAAADIYGRLEQFKDASTPPSRWSG